MDLGEFRINAQKKKSENRAFYNRLKNKKPSGLDDLFQEAHYEVFESVDCLTCANCCKTTSPIFYQRDIERAARATRMKPGEFIEKYLRVDSDKDYVLQQAPCPFLDSENYCSIYADRPTACREYPHTNRKKIQQILDLTYMNTLVCPAVLRITEILKNKAI
jgi:Fe-S-cluster containining protein